MRREQVFWGWGEPGAGPSLPEHAARVPARRARRRRRRRGAARWRSTTCGCAAGARPPARARGWRRSSAPTHVRDDREARVLRCRGKSLPRPAAPSAPATASDAPDAVVAPGRPRRGAGGAAGVRRGGRRGRAVRRRHERRRRRSSRERGRLRRAWSRSTSARMDRRRSSVDERSLTAVLEPGHPAARGRPRARRARPHARPRAAELRVGDGRRLRGDPLGRPVVDRARADRRRTSSAVRLRDAARGAGHARRARDAPPGRRCASSWSARRARSA